MLFLSLAYIENGPSFEKQTSFLRIGGNDKSKFYAIQYFCISAKKRFPSFRFSNPALSITHSKETMSKFQLFKLSTMTFPFKILHVFLLAKKVINSCLADDGILFNQIWSSEININRWVH